MHDTSLALQLVGDGKNFVPDSLALTIAAMIANRYGRGDYVCSSAKDSSCAITFAIKR
jgi:hypothetical protein